MGPPTTCFALSVLLPAFDVRTIALSSVLWHIGVALPVGYLIASLLRIRLPHDWLSGTYVTRR
ncbi:MAG: hypothetical protein NXI31_14590 [bacterium]|nr:hypothetical protein [bacterium]